jgi:uncharacterized protein
VTLAHNRWVAFEVDEVEGIFDWRSVVVRGSVYVLDPEGAELERHAYEEAVALMRSVVPETFSRDDPIAFRYLVFRIHVDEITGRAAESRAG